MNRPAHYFRFYLLSIFVITVLAGMVSCRYLSIPAKDDAVRGLVKPKGTNGSTVYNSAVIKGRIVSHDNGKDSTLVIAYRPGDGKEEFTEYVATNGSNAFMLYLPEGRYQLFAITDYNHNGIYENDEVSGLYGSDLQPAEISIREGELITGVVIPTARDNSHKIKLPLEWQVKKDQKIIQQVTHNGQALKIYHEYFSLENAQTGYWNPSSFMKAFGAHIYLAEEYNPRKIPVLFVHGTEGSPYNWIYFYMRLDRSRYQPWFFYYPSGIRLPLAAALLNEELRELQIKYGFQKMAIGAHSVGGLTTRSFLTRFAADKQNNYVKLFVTFATPWRGFGAADASQIMIHKSIPVWVDLGTQSAFIKTTMGDKLPAYVNHYNLYGKNDKVCGDKALDDRAVACAVKSFGFDCTHDTILSDRKVFFKFNEILNKELW
jgi:pimeloyl-ACP methyl ester carboxylesterase